MGKSKTPKGLQAVDNSGQSNNSIYCTNCNTLNPINLVCTDQNCNKQDQLQAICATCHYTMYHSSVSLETYLKKIQVIFQESLAIIEIDQKKLLQFQESLNQTYFMIENLKLKTFEQLQEQENQRQQLLSLLGTIKNLEEYKYSSSQLLKDKVCEISKVLILDPKQSEENPIHTTMNFYSEFVYQCEMEIWIKFNRYFTQKRDWVVKTEEENDSYENLNQNSNQTNQNFAMLNSNVNINSCAKNENQLRQVNQRDRLKKDILYGNQSQMETENLQWNNNFYDSQNKRGINDDTENSKEDEELHFEVEKNPDEQSDDNIDEDDDDDEEEDEQQEEDEDDGDFQYKQRKGKSNTYGNNGTINNYKNSSNQHQNGYHSSRNKSGSTNQRYHTNGLNNNEFNQSSSHSNVPKGTHGTIRKIRELSVKEKLTILQEYDSTGDIRTISNKYNIKYRRLYNFIQNSRGPNNQSIRQYSDEHKQLIYNDYLESKNVREVANKWKLNYDSLYSFIRYKKQK